MLIVVALLAAGATLLTVAGFLVAAPLGFAVAGVACLAAAYLAGDGS